MSSPLTVTPLVYSPGPPIWPATYLGPLVGRGVPVQGRGASGGRPGRPPPPLCLPSLAFWSEPHTPPREGATPLRGCAFSAPASGPRSAPAPSVKVDSDFF